MHCPKCGADIGNAKFCPECGTEVGDAKRAAIQDAANQFARGESSPKRRKKPIIRRWWFWVIVVVLAIGIIGSIGENDSKPAIEPPNTSTVETEASETAELPNSTPAEPTPTPAPEMTMGQKNALQQALNYLDLMSFSYTGLVKQLEFEGYSNEEAVFAVDHCGADWFEQAALKAQEYIDYMSFSRQGLIDQLLFEGFTQEQAEYGVTAVGY